MRVLLLVACVLAMSGTAKAQNAADQIMDFQRAVLRDEARRIARMTPEEKAQEAAAENAKIVAEQKAEKDAKTRLSKRAAHSTRPRMLSRRTNRAAMAAKKAGLVPQAPPQQPPLNGAKPSAK